MINTVTVNKNISPINLKRLFRYGLLSEKHMQAGEVLTSIEKLARQSGESTRTVIADLAEYEIPVSNGNIIQFENLIAAVKKNLPNGSNEKVILAGSSVNISRLMQNYEFAGYAFNIQSVIYTDKPDNHAPFPGVRPLPRQSSKDSLSCTTAILCTGYADAQEMADYLIANGITCIWNFTPISLETIPGIRVENVIPGYPKWKGKAAEYNLS